MPRANITDFRNELPGEQSDPQTFTFKPLVSRNRNGKTTSWCIVVRVCVESSDKTEDSDGNYPGDKFVDIDPAWYSSVAMPSGLVAWCKVISSVADGKIKKCNPTYVRLGKNINKANATNPFTQALRDALGKYNKQDAKSGADDAIDGPNGTKLYPCMLAQPLKDQKDFNWDQLLTVQLKLNGVRAVCVADENGDTVMYSRTRKIYPGFNYMKPAISRLVNFLNEKIGQNVYVDGEVYKHGVSLQLISGAARQELNDSSQESMQLEYWIYDVFVPADPTLLWTTREQLLVSAREYLTGDIDAAQYIRVVESRVVTDQAAVNAAYEDALASGYEGVMLRVDQPYAYSYNDYHSKSLLKVKPCLEGEYKIINYTQGTKGKSEGALMFVLATASGVEFTINLGMELSKRKELYGAMGIMDESGKTLFEREYLGRQLTILYDELSVDQVPVRARTDGIVVRDYE
jgi:hypothetical protein